MNLCVMISWLYWRHFQSLDLKVKEKQMGKISAKDKIITHILYLVWYSQVLSTVSTAVFKLQFESD